MKGPKFGDGLLPNTRRQQFFETFKYHFSEIFVASIYTFLFFVPCLVWILFVSYSPLLSENSIFNTLIIYSVLAVLFAIYGLGSCGGKYFYKKIMYNEGANIHIDFYKGIKENGKVFFVNHLLIGIIYALLHIAIQSLNNVDISSIAKSFIVGCGYGVLFIFIILKEFDSIQNIYYTTNKGQRINNSLRFFIGSLFQALGIFLLTYFPFIAFEFCPVFYVKIICIAFYGLIYFGISSLIWVLFSLSIFDKAINKNQFKDNYRKGLSNQ